jgi:urea transporter
LEESGICSIGTCIGWSTSVIVGADQNLIMHGLYGYNATLTMIALSAVFLKNQFIGMLGAILSVFVMAAFTVVLEPFEIPVFTLPFTITTWFFILLLKNDHEKN